MRTTVERLDAVLMADESLRQCNASRYCHHELMGRRMTDEELAAWDMTQDDRVDAFLADLDAARYAAQCEASRKEEWTMEEILAREG